MGHLVHSILLRIPLLRVRLILITVLELSGVLSSQEVRDGVAIFDLDSTQRQDTVECRPESLSGEEAQSIADVDDDMPWARLDVLPGAVRGREDLKTPLRSVENSQTANVGMHVLADLLRVLGSGRVVKEVQGALRTAVITVVSLKASLSLQAEAIGETIEEELGDEMASRSELIE